MPRSSPRKRYLVQYNEESDGATDVSKVNGASKAIDEIKSAATKAAAKVNGKRKLAAVIGGENKSEDTKQPKKRKSKAKTEDSAMPLMDRTAVSSLKKTMYIGAHVSAAGGESDGGVLARARVTYFLPVHN